MSGVVKGIKKAGKGIVKGVKKAFNSITSTTFGKIVLLAVVIYFGGAALGQWASGTAIDGMLVPAVAEAGAGTAAASTVTGAGSPGLTAYTAGEAAAGAGTVTGSGSPGLAAWSAGKGATDAAIVAGGGIPAQGVAGGFMPNLANNWLKGSGLVVDAIKGLGTFAEANPIASAMGVSAIAGALTPTEAEGQMDLEKWRQDQVHKNMKGVGDIQTVSPGASRITRPSGAPVYGPRGLIQSRMQGG